MQSAVSRQREFLADASAIQYTRNPDGLGNALRKLGKNSLRGRMLRPKWNQQEMPDTVRLQAVAAWRAGLAPELVEAAHDPLRARQVVFALLLHGKDDRVLRALKQAESETCVQEVETLLGAQEIRDQDRLGLLDLCLPALRHLREEEQAGFMLTVKVLSESDAQTDLFEFCLGKILAHNFESRNGKPGYSRMRVHIPKLERELNVILSLLSRLGSDTEADAERSFQKAREWMLGYTGKVELKLLPSSECGLDALDAACEKLPGLAPAFQERLLLAGLAAIAADDDLQPMELQAYRALAATLHIPVPPGLGFA